VICTLFLFYGWAIIPFSYLFGFLFVSFGNAQVMSFFVHFILGGIFPLLMFILNVIQSTRDAAKALVWIFRLVPSFAFGNGVVRLGNLSFLAIL